MLFQNSGQFALGTGISLLPLPAVDIGLGDGSDLWFAERITLATDSVVSVHLLQLLVDPAFQLFQLAVREGSVKLNIPVMIWNFTVIFENRGNGKVTHIKFPVAHSGLKGLFSLIDIKCLSVLIQHIINPAFNDKPKRIKRGEF